MDDSNIRFLTATHRWRIAENRAPRKDSAVDRILKGSRGYTNNLIDLGVPIEAAGATVSLSYDDRKWELEEQLIEPPPARRRRIRRVTRKRPPPRRRRIRRVTRKRPPPSTE